MKNGNQNKPYNGGSYSYEGRRRPPMGTGMAEKGAKTVEQGMKRRMGRRIPRRGVDY